MMSLILAVFFTLCLCFFKNLYWMSQMMIYLLVFMFMMYYPTSFYCSNLSYMFGVDLISYFLIFLSIWISGLMILASMKLMNFKISEFFFLFNILILLFLLICTFSSLNLFLFYLFFEGSLIPVLFLIMGWGGQPERIQAGLYLLFYTLFVSLPMLLGIFYLDFKYYSLMIYLMKFGSLNFSVMYLVMMLSFLVKIPMFFVHLWLPKAHVEAPVSGSMILAGIMLKLGGYGIMRVLIFMENLNMKFNYYLISVSLLGALYVSLMCFFQIDLKSLIAYSSVVHMGMMLGGLLTLTNWGFSGGLIMMIGHGLCSSGLFCLVNLNYERLNSRNLFINKGLLNLMPSLSLWWFMFLSSNMAAPPSLNLLGEICLLISLLSWSIILMGLLAFLSFFSAGYSLYLFSFMQHGKFINQMNNFYSGECREYLLLLLHWVPLNMLILKMDFFY
uniref:NADH-ubiquinone oxidoreductase chain 4 n=1 Tax=Lepidostoma longipilosum TaxID=2904889 RepID=A0A9E8LP98_9NEOP|nr:NADH dehydrogenase subunit 4 [Lepidostoma longipilosum]UZZ43644.1 NADH dehydrogenase subunit 4 [Lepidostoma longipilosum]